MFDLEIASNGTDERLSPGATLSPLSDSSLMKRLLALSAVLLLALTTTLASGRDQVAVSGHVLDVEGEALMEYEIATSFCWQDGELLPEEGFTIDEEGNFSGEVEFLDDEATLVVYSTDRKTGAVYKISSSDTDELKIELKKTVRVWGSVTCEELGQAPTWFNVSWNLEEASVITCDSSRGKFDLRLPVAFWNYDLYDTWFSTLRGELPLDGKLRVVDMGKLDLPASYLALNEGRVIEDWTPTAARNIKLDKANLKSMRGKWVLVEFWGYQYETSTQESLPELVEFYEDNHSDKFEIIAFHENSVRGFVDLDKKVSAVRSQYWKGRRLPFPILLDDTGDTLRRFQIGAFPTTILIDPDGRLIANASISMLKDALAGRLTAPEPR